MPFGFALPVENCKQVSLASEAQSGKAALHVKSAVVLDYAEIKSKDSAGFISQCEEAKPPCSGDTQDFADDAIRQKDKEYVNFISKQPLKRQYSPKEIIKTKQYYLLLWGLILTLPAYFILNPVFLTLGTVRGLSEELAVLGVALTGIGSASGRLTVPWISDKTGRKSAMIAVAIIILFSSLVIIKGEGVLFLICITLISYGFGGTASVYSAMTADSFGTKYGGMNFGLVMIGFGTSALVFPLISSTLTAGGSYTSSFILSAATCVIAIVLVLLMENPKGDNK
jgi:hypothetical protein